MIIEYCCKKNYNEVTKLRNVYGYKKYIKKNEIGECRVSFDIDILNFLLKK